MSVQYWEVVSPAIIFFQLANVRQRVVKFLLLPRWLHRGQSPTAASISNQFPNPRSSGKENFDERYRGLRPSTKCWALCRCLSPPAPAKGLTFVALASTSFNFTVNHVSFSVNFVGFSLNLVTLASPSLTSISTSLTLASTSLAMRQLR